jgi:hypothetical protein
MLKTAKAEAVEASVGVAGAEKRGEKIELQNELQNELQSVYTP